MKGIISYIRALKWGIITLDTILTDDFFNYFFHPSWNSRQASSVIDRLYTTNPCSCIERLEKYTTNPCSCIKRLEKYTTSPCSCIKQWEKDTTNLSPCIKRFYKGMTMYFSCITQLSHYTWGFLDPPDLWPNQSIITDLSWSKEQLQ